MQGQSNFKEMHSHKAARSVSPLGLGCKDEENIRVDAARECSQAEGQEMRTVSSVTVEEAQCEDDLASGQRPLLLLTN